MIYGMGHYYIYICMHFLVVSSNRTWTNKEFDRQVMIAFRMDGESDFLGLEGELKKICKCEFH